MEKKHFALMFQWSTRLNDERLHVHEGIKNFTYIFNSNPMTAHTYIIMNLISMATYIIGYEIRSSGNLPMTISNQNIKCKPLVACDNEWLMHLAMACSPEMISEE